MLVPSRIVLLELIKISRAHYIRTPEIKRPDRGENLACRMVTPLNVLGSLSYTRRRLNTKLAQAVDVAADEVIRDPFLPLILVCPRVHRSALF